MNPETKEILDYLLAILGPSALGGIALGLFGWLKARADKPHIAPDKPTVGNSAMATLGGMVMGQQDLQDLIKAFQAIAASYDRCTLMRETEMEANRKAATERRVHESKLAEEGDEEWRQGLRLGRLLVEVLEQTNSRLAELSRTIAAGR